MSCEAAESVEDALLRMARVNCNLPKLLAVNYCFTACSSASTRGSSSGTGPSCPGSLCTSVPVCRGRAGNSSKTSLFALQSSQVFNCIRATLGRLFYAMLRLFHRKISHSDPPRGCTGTIPHQHRRIASRPLDLAFVKRKKKLIRQQIMEMQKAVQYPQINVNIQHDIFHAVFTKNLSSGSAGTRRGTRSASPDP